MGLGELAALAAALLWTISSMFWGRVNLPAMSLNFAKNFFGCLLIFIHLWVVTRFTGAPVFSATATSWGWFILSGTVGIVLGDSFYFRCLQILGPRKAMMLATTAPLSSVLLGWLILGENITVAASLGIMMAVAGVMVVVSDRKSKSEAPGLMPGAIAWGVWAGILSAICQALGGVLGKRGLNDVVTGEQICDPLEGTFIRVFVGAVGTVIVMLLRGRIVESLRKVFSWEQVRLVVPATAIGTWIGIWLALIAYQNTSISIAQTLLTTCPLFAIPIVWYSGKHQLTVISAVGTVIAILGVFIALQK